MRLVGVSSVKEETLKTRRLHNSIINVKITSGLVVTCLQSQHSRCCDSQSPSSGPPTTT